MALDYENIKLLNHERTVPHYSAIHKWIVKMYGSAGKCEGVDCSRQSITYDWANISGEYRRDVNDWKQLCRSCHFRQDCTDQKRELLRRVNIGNGNHNRPIAQIGMDGRTIKKFKSAAEAQVSTGISRKTISMHLRNNTNHAGGYKWAYL